MAGPINRPASIPIVPAAMVGEIVPTGVGLNRDIRPAEVEGASAIKAPIVHGTATAAEAGVAVIAGQQAIEAAADRLRQCGRCAKSEGADRSKEFDEPVH